MAQCSKERSCANFRSVPGLALKEGLSTARVRDREGAEWRQQPSARVTLEGAVCKIAKIFWPRQLLVLQGATMPQVGGSHPVHHPSNQALKKATCRRASELESLQPRAASRRGRSHRQRDCPKGAQPCR